MAEWTASANGGIAPTGTALATEGGTTYLYVSDHPRGRILKFDAATGSIVGTFGSLGSGNGQFSQPYGIAIDRTTGDLYVAERGNNRIQRITNTGTFVMAWGSSGTAAGQFAEPTGVAVDAAGDVYVSEHGNHRVQKFHVTQTAGTWSAANVAMWGSLGSGNGQFNTPYSVTVDAANNVWVADGFNGRVQRFNTSGVYQSTLGGAGTGPGQFVVATGVTTDASGAVYVTSTNSDPTNTALADANSQWVSKFTSTGTFVSRFGGVNGTAPGQFRLPFSVAVSTANRAYVADFGNNRVQVFDLSGGSTDTTPPTIASFTPGTASGNTVNFTLTFSEPVTGVDAADITATPSSGATATIGTISGTGATRTIPVTFSGTGTITLTVAGGATANIQDAAGNLFAGGAGSTSTVFTIPVGSADTTPPTVDITVAGSTATSVTFNLAFSETVTGGAATAFTATGAGGATGVSIASVTPSASSPTTSYTVVVNYTGTAGTVTLGMSGAASTAIKDASNNFFAGGATAGGATSRTYTITSSGGGGDTTRPTITSFDLDGASATATSARMIVTFSEPVTGVDQSDFEVKGTLTAGATITGVTPGATAATYNVAFNYTGTSGSLQMAIKTSGTGIADTAGNAFVGGGIAATAAYPVNNAPPSDMTLPTVSSFSTPTGTLASPVNLTLVFSEAVTGVSADDFVVSPGATVGTVTGSGTTWTVPVSFTGTTPVSVMIVGGATSNIRDAATHWFAGGTAACTVTFTPGSTGGGGGSGTAPVISSPLTASVVAGAPFSYTITATNSPTAFTASGLPAGLTFSSPTISGTVATAGTYNITIGATNASGTDTKTLVLTVTAPGGGSAGTHVVSVTPPLNGTYGEGQTLNFTVTFSAPVTVRTAVAAKGGKSDDKKGDDNDEEDDAADTAPYFTWTAVAAPGQKAASGKVAYVSGSGGTALTFRYIVRKDDVAPNGITLGTSIQMPGGASIRDAAGNSLTGSALTLPWAANPLTGVILNGGASDKGKGPVVVIKRGDGLLAGQPFTLPATDASGRPITWILVSGNATLNGNVLTPKNRGAVVVRAVIAGTSSSAATDYQIEGEDDAKAAKSHGPTPNRDRLSNLSSRLRVSSSDSSRAAIAGFVVTGQSTKQVLVRAIGPGLAAFGVSDAVAAARLRLYDQGGAVIAQNDGWGSSAAIVAAADRVGAFTLANGSADSAVLITLKPGAYTAEVGANGSGIALLEVYDATSAAEASTEQLINISTRGYVDSGDGNLIAGFVVTGDAPKRVLVRGIGSALTAFGVPGVLADPMLALYTSGGATMLARNDNWEAPQSATTAAATASDIMIATKATGAFPLAGGSKDAAILITLMPGSYSAVVSGANRTTGAGLVEVYEVPNP